MLRVGLGNEPPAITTLAADLSACGPTFVALTWSAVTTVEVDGVVHALSLPVLGYIVQMIDPITDEWVDIYDASTNPDALSYTHFGLVTGETYTFRTFAVNFNGRSTQVGKQVNVLACGWPRVMDLPTYVTSTRTSITLKWAPPVDDGGCAIHGYAVFRDEDGTTTQAGAAAATWTLVNPLQQHDPTLLEFTCTDWPAEAAPSVPPAAPTTFVFKVRATNRQGSVDSLLSAPMILAGPPEAPASAPSSDAAVTDHQRIKLTYDAVTDATTAPYPVNHPFTGGSAILSYEL